jgi:hypothetical protein
MLRRELRRLEKLLGFNVGELKLEWSPEDNPKNQGEVIGTLVIIRDKDPKVARETLKHELVELLISRSIEAPYKRLTVNLFKLIDEEIYRKREELVEKLAQLL